MMQVNKQAKVMSNCDVMGRGPTNEVSRQTAFSHTKIQLRQTAGGHACGTRYLFGLCKIRLAELIMGREITERIAEKVGILRELSSEFDLGSYRSSI
jgi:hypothetical protein